VIDYRLPHGCAQKEAIDFIGAWIRNFSDVDSNAATYILAPSNVYSYDFRNEYTPLELFTSTTFFATSLGQCVYENRVWEKDRSILPSYFSNCIENAAAGVGEDATKVISAVDSATRTHHIFNNVIVPKLLSRKQPYLVDGSGFEGLPKYLLIINGYRCEEGVTCNVISVDNACYLDCPTFCPAWPYAYFRDIRNGGVLCGENYDFEMDMDAQGWDYSHAFVGFDISWGRRQPGGGWCSLTGKNGIFMLIPLFLITIFIFFIRRKVCSKALL
jgi:hypothetical protein